MSDNPLADLAHTEGRPARRTPARRAASTPRPRRSPASRSSYVSLAPILAGVSIALGLVLFFIGLLWAFGVMVTADDYVGPEMRDLRGITVAIGLVPAFMLASSGVIWMLMGCAVGLLRDIAVNTGR